MKNEKYLSGLSSELKNFLNDLDFLTQKIFRREITLTDGVRTYEQQKKLWDNRKSNPYPVGHPDDDLTHYTGEAADFSYNSFKDIEAGFVAVLRSVLNRYPNIGWGGDWSKRDPVHFYIKNRSGNSAGLFVAGLIAFFSYKYITRNAK